VRSLIPLTANQQAAAAVVDTVSKRQQLEDARNLENLKAIKSQLAQGIPFLKHNRKGKVKKRIFKSVDLEASLVRWEALPGEPERSVLASSDRPRRVRDIIMIQRGFEQDPAKPEYGGTKTLRRSAGKKAIFKSFSLHFFDRTLDMEFASVKECDEVRASGPTVGHLTSSAHLPNLALAPIPRPTKPSNSSSGMSR